ncbi:phosphohistidine phosphatase SixA [Tundrisphaera sp. TA3]|uniref:phosphohistidine phosphatase SixA n=1 Tax=Tundrisphaera sp. TA3 TaxID=3435775 RepID=UPI003EBB25B5
MKTLYLVRHGIAVDPGPSGIPDDDRLLTPEGERKVRMVGLGLRRNKVKVDRIATSPLPRALKTAQIIAQSLKATDLLEKADELRTGRDAAAVRDWLAARTETRMMIVGHNPWISELLALLTTGQASPLICDIRKAGVVALRSAGPEGAYQIDWIARPRLFRH